MKTKTHTIGRHGIFIFAALLIVLFSGCGTIKPVALTPFSDGEYSATNAAIQYQSLQFGKTYTVPAGFVTDYTSVPRIAWPILPRTGPYQWAAVVHDYLYWEQNVPRSEADAVFKEAMAAADIKPWKREVIFTAVDKFGYIAWNKNKQDKADGIPKSIKNPTAGFILSRKTRHGRNSAH